jgi:hypothetical protein
MSESAVQVSCLSVACKDKSGEVVAVVSAVRMGSEAQVHFHVEVNSCRPVNFTDSRTQPFHESSAYSWQHRSPSLSRGRRPPLGRL